MSLLEAQAATGSIIDPENGAKMSVTDAKTSGLIDRQFEAVLSRAERAVTGYSIRNSNEKLSLFQAMKQVCNIIKAQYPFLSHHYADFRSGEGRRKSWNTIVRSTNRNRRDYRPRSKS